MTTKEKSTLIQSDEDLDKILPAQIRGAYRYWRSICDGLRFPSRKDIDPTGIYKLLPYVMLIDIPENPQDMRIRLMGSAIISFLGYNPTGQLLIKHLESDESTHLLDGYFQVIKERHCHYIENALFSGKSRTIRYHRLICPLSSDGQRIDCVLSIGCFDRLDNLYEAC